MHCKTCEITRNSMVQSKQKKPFFQRKPMDSTSYVQRYGFGDVRMADGYRETKNRILNSQKFKALHNYYQESTQLILAEIDKQAGWPAKVSFMNNIDVPFARNVKLSVMETAKTEILKLPVEGRRVTKLFEILAKPFSGYTTSGFDYSQRFFQQQDKLGFGIENPALASHMTPDPYDGGQTSAVTGPAEKSFEKSDIVFFSGHQYAQYRTPGQFGSDDITACFNISMISKALKRVKLVVSTSCATICKDVAKIWQNKFPDATILGYRFSAPLDGSKVANAFGDELVKKGPIDLADMNGMKKVKDSWKAVVLAKHSIAGGPGILEGNEVEIWNKNSWQKKPVNDKANECRYH